MTQTDERRPVGAPNGPAEDTSRIGQPAAFRADVPADPAGWLDGYDSGEAVGRTLGYVAGHRDGYDRGRADGYDVALAEVEALESEWRDAMNKQAVRTVLARGDYAELAERRGQPERAAAQRELLRANGVVA